jgi:hypothetical protein
VRLGLVEQRHVNVVICHGLGTAVATDIRCHVIAGIDTFHDSVVVGTPDGVLCNSAAPNEGTASFTRVRLLATRHEAHTPIPCRQRDEKLLQGTVIVPFMVGQDPTGPEDISVYPNVVQPDFSMSGGISAGRRFHGSSSARARNETSGLLRQGLRCRHNRSRVAVEPGFVINQPHNIEVEAHGQKFLVNRPSTDGRICSPSAPSSTRC